MSHHPFYPAPDEFLIYPVFAWRFPINQAPNSIVFLPEINSYHLLVTICVAFKYSISNSEKNTILCFHPKNLLQTCF